jgi:hypothetical protein
LSGSRAWAASEERVKIDLAWCCADDMERAMKRLMCAGVSAVALVRRTDLAWATTLGERAP